MKTLALILLLFSTTAHAEWSEKDTQRQLIFTGLAALDWGQTRYIAKHPDEYYERNPLLGAHPTTGRVDGYFTSSILLHWGISAMLPDKWRKYWQYTGIAVETGAVANNYSLGIRLDF